MFNSNYQFYYAKDINLHTASETSHCSHICWLQGHLSHFTVGLLFGVEGWGFGLSILVFDLGFGPIRFQS